jgi:hypothetical protein
MKTSILMRLDELKTRDQTKKRVNALGSSFVANGGVLGNLDSFNTTAVERKHLPVQRLFTKPRKATVTATGLSAFVGGLGPKTNDKENRKCKQQQYIKSALVKQAPCAETSLKWYEIIAKPPSTSPLIKGVRRAVDRVRRSNRLSGEPCEIILVEQQTQMDVEPMESDGDDQPALYSPSPMQPKKRLNQQETPPVKLISSFPPTPGEEYDISLPFTELLLNNRNADIDSLSDCSMDTTIVHDDDYSVCAVAGSVKERKHVAKVIKAGVLRDFKVGDSSKASMKDEDVIETGKQPSTETQPTSKGHKDQPFETNIADDVSVEKELEDCKRNKQAVIDPQLGTALIAKPKPRGRSRKNTKEIDANTRLCLTRRDRKQPDRFVPEMTSGDKKAHCRDKVKASSSDVEESSTSSSEFREKRAAAAVKDASFVKQDLTKTGRSQHVRAPPVRFGVYVADPETTPTTVAPVLATNKSIPSTCLADSNLDEVIAASDGRNTALAGRSRRVRTEPDRLGSYVADPFDELQPADYRQKVDSHTVPFPEKKLGRLLVRKMPMVVQKKISSRELDAPGIDGWTPRQFAQLKAAYIAVDPKLYCFWDAVSEQVSDKTPQECRDKWFSSVKTPAKRRQVVKGAASESDEDEDDIFNSTPLRESADFDDERGIGVKAHALFGLDLGSAIKVSKRLDQVRRESNVTDAISEPQFRPRAGYKTYIQNMRRDAFRPKVTKKKAGKVITANALKATVQDGDINMKGQLTPGGTLKVQTKYTEPEEEEDDFFDEIDEDDESE